MSGGDHLVAWSNSACAQDQQQTDRSARHRDGVFAAQIIGEFNLELLGRRTRGEMLRQQDFIDGVEIAPQ